MSSDFYCFNDEETDIVVSVIAVIIFKLSYYYSSIVFVLIFSYSCI